MELKIKTSGWSTSVPVVMINEKDAIMLGAHVGDRVTLKTKSNVSKKSISILD